MKQNIWQRAEEYVTEHKHKKYLYICMSCLAAAVVLVTSYMLMLPAVTLEETCELQEHTHTKECYEPIQTVKVTVPVCELEGAYIHQHDAYCYDVDGVFWCKLEEKKLDVEEVTESEAEAAEPSEAEVIEPSEAEVTEPSEAEVTEPSEAEATSLLVEENPVEEAAKQEQYPSHQHTEECFKEEEIPVDFTELTCTETHEHTELCYGRWKLVCTLEEHTHEEECHVTSEALENEKRVAQMIELIDTLGSMEAMQETLCAYEAAEDVEGYVTYYTHMYQQAIYIYDCYEKMPEELKQLVTNSDQLEAFEWLYTIEELNLLKSHTISLTNCVTAEDTDILGNRSDQFQILKVDTDGNKTEESVFAEGILYQIFDETGAPIGTGTVGANGIFTLKTNETAVFPEVSVLDGAYYVRELLRKQDTEQCMTDEMTFCMLDDTQIYDMFALDDEPKMYTMEQTTATVGEENFVCMSGPICTMIDGISLFSVNSRMSREQLGTLSITSTFTALLEKKEEKLFTISVMLDGKPLEEGTSYTVGEATKTVSAEGTICLAENETAVISNIMPETTFTVKETDASAEGMVVSYELNETMLAAGEASGTIAANAATAVKVHHSEKGTVLQIPVIKQLESPNGKRHDYKILLEEIAGLENPVSAESAFYRELPISVTIDDVCENFVIGYAEKDMENLPKTFYYKITEAHTIQDIETTTDPAVYIIEVTVSKQDDGTLSAVVTNMWKDGDNCQAVVFRSNTICFELPSTGGSGTKIFYAAGSVLVLAAVVLLIARKRMDHKK